MNDNRASTQESTCTIIPSTGAHTATIIFLHGFGEIVDISWAPILSPLNSDLKGLKWVLPQAPLIPSSYNNGVLFPAWFDTPTLNFLDSNSDDIPNQDKAIQLLLSLIERERRSGVKVFVGGYSQGGTIALLTILTGGVKVDGLVVLRGWVATSQDIRQELKDGYQKTPGFWAAGEEDDVVTPAITNRSLDLVKDLGLAVTSSDPPSRGNDETVFSWYSCEGGAKPHAVGRRELEDMATWLDNAMRT